MFHDSPLLYYVTVIKITTIKDIGTLGSGSICVGFSFAALLLSETVCLSLSACASLFFGLTLTLGGGSSFLTSLSLSFGACGCFVRLTLALGLASTFLFGGSSRCLLGSSPCRLIIGPLASKLFLTGTFCDFRKTAFFCFLFGLTAGFRFCSGFLFRLGLFGCALCGLLSSFFRVLFLLSDSSEVSLVLLQSGLRSDLFI